MTSSGRRTVDASGQIVAPGFIDILANMRLDRAAHEFKIGDGVTTVLGMHGGPVDIADYRRSHAEVGPLVNYAATVGHSAMREAVGATDPYQPATAEQIEAMRRLAVQSIRDGAVGIGFGINYNPGASYEEIFALFAVAAAEGVPCHLHARYKGNVFPLTMSLAVMEVVSMAAATGAQAQMAHLISSTVGSAPLSIALIEGASARGVDVGFDFHVWTRNQTWLQSALFDEGWQERFGGADYSDIYVADTQEQLTEERFFELRAQPGLLSVQTEFIPEEEMIMGLQESAGNCQLRRWRAGRRTRTPPQHRNIRSLPWALRARARDRGLDGGHQEDHAAAGAATRTINSRDGAKGTSADWHGCRRDGLRSGHRSGAGELCRSGADVRRHFVCARQRHTRAG